MHCLGFCTADFWSSLDYESAEKNQPLPNLRLPISSVHVAAELSLPLPVGAHEEMSAEVRELSEGQPLVGIGVEAVQGPRSCGEIRAELLTIMVETRFLDSIVGNN